MKAKNTKSISIVIVLFLVVIHACAKFSVSKKETQAKVGEIKEEVTYNGEVQFKAGFVGLTDIGLPREILPESLLA